MYKTIVPIKGMHCRSCELLIHDELEQVPGIERIQVSHKKAEAVLYHHTGTVDMNKVESAVAQAGYQVGEEAPKPWFSQNYVDYQHLLQAAAALGVIYLLAVFTGAYKYLDPSGISTSSLPLIFLIGITAGLSTCMAVVGGLVLGLSTRFSQQHPNASTFSKLRPQLLFNIGRVASYALLGGVIGLLGSMFTLSSSLLGFLTLGIGFLMLIFGLQLTGISPRLAQFSFTLPSGIGRFFGLSNTKSQGYGDMSSALTGAATFFLPCGFTQAMQLLAIASGSFTQGALILGTFALGTMPGLLGVGSLASVVKGAFAQKFYKLAGLVILFFAWINLSSGWHLTGGSRVLAAAAQPSVQGVAAAAEPSKAAPTKTAPATATILKATWKQRSWLSPQTLQTTVGSPTTLEVDVAENGMGCAGTITIPGLYSDYESLQKGNTLKMAFTPKKPGNYPITCGMGMITFGHIIVK